MVAVIFVSSVRPSPIPLAGPRPAIYGTETRQRKPPCAGERRRPAGCRTGGLTPRRSPTEVLAMNLNPIVFALRHPITVMVGIVAVVVGSVLAMVRMKIDIFPSLNLPVVYVAQPYGGMDP